MRWRTNRAVRAVRSIRLAIRGGGLGLRYHANGGGIEDVGSYFSFVALGGDFFAIQQEADSGGVACPYYYLAGGTYGGVRRSDQCFFGHGFAVRRDRNPTRLLGTDQQGDRDRRIRRCGRSSVLCERRIGDWGGRVCGRLTGGASPGWCCGCGGERGRPGRCGHGGSGQGRRTGCGCGPGCEGDCSCRRRSCRQCPCLRCLSGLERGWRIGRVR